jgi:hypothetical protein
MSGLSNFIVFDAPDVGMHGVRYVTQGTAQSSRILGGAEEDTSAADSPTAEGCSGSFPPLGTYACTVEQALYNAIYAFFEDTAAATMWGWSMYGTAPLNYLEIYAPDINYANRHTTPVSITTSDSPVTTTASMTAQEILNLAVQGSPRFPNSRWRYRLPA